MVGHPGPHRLVLPVRQRDVPSWTRPRHALDDRPLPLGDLLLPRPNGCGPGFARLATASRAVGKCRAYLNRALRRHDDTVLLRRERRRNAAAFRIGGPFGAGAPRPWSSTSAVLWSIQDLGHTKLGALQRGPMRRAVCFSLLADRPQRGAWLDRFPSSCGRQSAPDLH